MRMPRKLKKEIKRWMTVTDSRPGPRMRRLMRRVTLRLGRVKDVDSKNTYVEFKLIRRDAFGNASESKTSV